jgi:glycosyltransferase involved in cell wall biosynthesis
LLTMSESDPSILLFSGRFAVRGSCSYTLRLAEHLPLQGFRSAVICPDARQVEPERRRDLHIREFSHLHLPLWSMVVRRMMVRQLRNDRPDLIHIQSRNAARHGMWLARQLRCPYVLTVHDYLQPHERLAIDRRWCQRVIAVSESVKADLRERSGLPNDLVTVIHSGVDTDEALSESSVLSSDRLPVVGTAGPLEAVKGFPFFLGAAARVLAAGRDVEFVIAGAGPEESNLRRLAHELKVDSRVTFVPNLLEFDDALAAMDIFCLPSLQQGIGTIMLEAMAMGRPVIATRVGGVHRVVHDNDTGLLVPPSDSAALADRIIELLDNPCRARMIGHAAREKVIREFSVDQMVSNTVGLYREAIAANSAAEQTGRVLTY